jgi:hypothetical protein
MSTETNPYDIAIYVPDKPGDGETIYARRMTRQVTFPANLTDSRGGSEVAATSSFTVSIRRNGTQFATGTISGGGTTMSYGAAAETVFAVGDKLTVVAPSPQDGALSGLDMTLAGSRE